MKVTQKHLRIAVLALGASLILYGLVKFLWKVDFGAFIEQNLPNTIFIAAAAIFLWNRSIGNQEKKRLEEEEAAKKKALEEAAPPETLSAEPLSIETPPAKPE